jgi:hypothetical protein
MIFGIGAVLFISLGILAIAAVIMRQQKALQEKQAQYLFYKKRFQLHQSQYNRLKKEVDKQKISFAIRLKEQDGLIAGLKDRKSYVRQMTALIRKELEDAEESVNQELPKMIQRRKLLVRKNWGELNVLKTVFNRKLAETRAEEQTLAQLIANRDRELKLLRGSEYKFSTAKQEYEKLRKRITDEENPA